MPLLYPAIAFGAGAWLFKGDTVEQQGLTGRDIAMIVAAGAAAFYLYQKAR